MQTLGKLHFGNRYQVQYCW